MTTNTYDRTIVIGAGLAGLTAAATLARAGRSVTVLERTATVAGGRAATTEHDGFRLNEGPHALYRDGRAMRVFNELGITPRGGDPALDGAGVWHDGAVRVLPTSPRALLGTKILAGRSKLRAGRILPLLQRGHDRAAGGLTLTEWFERRRVPADLRAMIEMYVRLGTYSNCPDVLAAPAALSQFKLTLGGVLYLHDGWRQLVDRLADVAKSAGAEIVTGAHVSCLQREATTWQLGLASGEVLPAGHVVIAAGGPQLASELAGEDPGWIERAGPPAIVATLDLGVRREPTTPILLSTGDALYGSTHAPPARLAPAGHGLIAVMRYLAPGERVDRHATRAGLDEHARRMGLGPDEVMMERYLHRMTVAHGTVQADIDRPSGRELAAKGLWCAGDWVALPRDGAQIPLLADAAVGSGVDAANGILQEAA